MYPVMHVLGHSVLTYYVCAAAAGAMGWLLSAISLRRSLHRSWKASLLLPLAVVVSAIIGARGLNILTNPGAYGEAFHPLTLQYTKLSLMGGLVAGGLVILLYCWIAGGSGEDSMGSEKREVKTGAVIDAFVIPTAVGIILLKLGCFLNGCCFGKPTEGPLGMVFPANASRYRFLDSLPLIRASSPRVHPTQLFEIGGTVLSLGLALLMEHAFCKEKTTRIAQSEPDNRDRGRGRSADGLRAAVFAAGFALTRLIVLPLRALPYPKVVVTVFYPALYGTVILVSVCLGWLLKKRG